MTVRHLPWLDPERWYVINVDRSDNGKPPWHSRLVSLHGPNSEASVEWSLLGHGFGFGFQVGRNGGESDLGLDLYAGKLASVWLRLRAPWTRWARIDSERDPKHWYYARHSGLRIHPFDGCIFQLQVENRDGMWERGQSWWRQWNLTTRAFLGRTRTEESQGDSGMTYVPLPEGTYAAVWTERRYVNRYTAPLGRLRDWVLGPRSHRFVDLRIDGGIPIEGKGESAHDCGMDGLFGCGGSTVADAVGNATKHVLRDRERYGGPHDLPHPMTVSEAENRQRA